MKYPIDLRSVRRSTVDGRPSAIVRTRVPFGFSRDGLSALPFGDAGLRAAPVLTEGEARADVLDGDGLLPGIASSTGRDWYGTEMSAACLENMAEQFRAGTVAYLRTHPGWSGGGEWDEQMGVVVDGKVEEATPEVVASCADSEEMQAILRVRTKLFDPEEPTTAKLLSRLRGGNPVGQSIGGWFTELEFVFAEGEEPETEDDWWWAEPERIIVHGVDLDHLAATRQPANRESWLDALRSAVEVRGVGLGERGAGGKKRIARPEARSAVAPSEVAPAAEAPPAAPVEEVRAEDPAMTGEEEVADDPPSETELGEGQLGDAPNYRPAESTDKSCSACAYFSGDAIARCTKYDALIRDTDTCDAFELAGSADDQRTAPTEEPAPVEPAPVEPAASPSERSATSAEAAGVDAPDATCHSPEQPGVDVVEDAPTDNRSTDDPEQEISMTPEQIAQLAAEAAAKAVEKALDARGIKAADAPTPTDPRDEKIEKLQRTVDSLIAAPNRRGIVNHGAAVAIEDLDADPLDLAVRAVEKEGRHMHLLSVSKSGSFVRRYLETPPAKASSLDGEEALRRIFRAAEADGLITAPGDHVAWGS